jgi:hypothetical protein
MILQPPFGTTRPRLGANTSCGWYIMSLSLRQHYYTTTTSSTPPPTPLVAAMKIRCTYCSTAPCRYSLAHCGHVARRPHLLSYRDLLSLGDLPEASPAIQSAIIIVVLWNIWKARNGVFVSQNKLTMLRNMKHQDLLVHRRSHLAH